MKVPPTSHPRRYRRLTAFRPSKPPCARHLALYPWAASINLTLTDSGIPEATDLHPIGTRLLEGLSIENLAQIEPFTDAAP